MQHIFEPAENRNMMKTRMEKTIVTSKSVAGFFSDLLTEVLQNQDVQLSEASTAYLVQVVSGFTDPAALHANNNREESGPPALFRLYEKAISSPPQEQFEAYRHLGDVSLFVSSFFAPHVERSVVSFEYYIQMGGSAYDRAATLDRTGKMRPLMRQLSEKFHRVVELLTQLAEKTSLPVCRDIANLYDRWSRNTNDQELYSRLIRQGAVPIGH